ncbi:hypothetical protein [Dictyobacter kobayashii]|uniref:Uncharacterized protein n=1 Tax=Dictyobacter kobayashii TaxID=2014872 RepID=A0A402AVC6_9CHLR|nr:hypothetical protein [Dictyobacter kobayashii]GCE22963.1 hypothetical protein KDK_67630 [Dictyobacter kobayashii]
MARKKKHPHSKPQVDGGRQAVTHHTGVMVTPDIPLTPLAQSWVKGRGLSLYILWKRTAGAAAALPEHAAIWSHHTPVNLWMVTQCQWNPATQPDDGWFTLAALLEGCDSLHAYLAAVRQAQKEVAYAILQLEEIQVTVPADVVKSMRRQKQYRKKALAESKDGAIEEALDILQQHLRLNESALEQGWSPGRFTHFDRETGQRGWLVISPREAIAARLSVQQVYNLSSLLQPQDIEWTGQRGAQIASSRYEPFYERVMQWNATNDIFETVVQLETLVEDGQRSTDGQLWLNFALAGIGVLLSLFSLSQLRWLQISALAGLALASIFHACYARFGKPLLQVLGWLFFALSLLVVVLLYTLK